MAEDGALRQEILQTTLKEVGLERSKDQESNPCVICLEVVSEQAVALPCRHDSFDFLCLVSWLEQQPNCPLCKANVATVKYNIVSDSDFKTYHVPTAESRRGQEQENTSLRRTVPSRRQYNRPSRSHRASSPPGSAILRRREIYRNELYSLHVGSNRLSRFQDFTPQTFSRDDELISRAKMWIRRELQVFEFLNPDSDTQAPANRRANNAEFLMEYIIAILKTVDIKGSGGQAEELLQEFLGRAHTRLFLHELQAWLRSPYISLENWDRNVQYPTTPQSAAGRESSASATERSNRDHSSSYRRASASAQPSRSKGRRSASSYHPYNESRRLQAARRRYQPD